MSLTGSSWKVMLPEMWREAAIFNENGVMDENLSLVSFPVI